MLQEYWKELHLTGGMHMLLHTLMLTPSLGRSFGLVSAHTTFQLA